MNKLFVLLLITLLGLATATYTPKIYITSDNYDHRKFDENYWGFRPAVYGGSGNYWYSWSGLPSGWQYYSSSFNSYSGYRDYVFWPYNTRYGRYQCSVKIYDIVYKVETTKYFVFDFSGSGDRFNVFVRDSYDEYYTYDSYNFETKDIFDYPSWKKVQMLIEDGDVRALSQIIDRTLESDNDCDDKRDFLNGMLDRIDNFIRDSSNTISRYEREIASNELSIASKQKQLNDLIKELRYNGLSELKIKLRNLLAEANLYERRISQSKSEISSNNVAIKQYEERIWQLKDVTIVSLRNSITKLQAHAADLIQKIRWGYGDVAWWRYELKDVHLMIGKKQKMLDDAEDTVKNLEWKVNFLKQKNRDLESRIFSDEKDLARTRAQITTVRGEIDATRDFSDINEDIEDIKMEIEDLKASVSDLKARIRRLEWAIKEIKQAREKFVWTIKKKLPYCKFQEGVEIVDEYTGHWSYDRFDKYLYSIWGTYPKRILTTKSSYHIQNVDLYSTQWYTDYWGDYSYDYKESFTCTGLYSRPAYYGRITRIGTNSVWAIDDDNVEWELSFSSCSVFQSATGSRYPVKGNYIIWNGSRRSYSGKQYRIRNAICL